MRYQKICSHIWNDEKFNTLSASEQRSFFYVLTCPHGNLIGLFVLKEGYAADDLKSLQKDFIKDLKVLCTRGFIKYDFETKLIWIKNFLKYNPITNPNQIKSALKTLSEQLPKSPLLKDFMDFNPALMERLPEGLNEVLSKESVIVYVNEDVDVNVYEPSQGAVILTTLFLNTMSEDFKNKFKSSIDWQKCFDKLLNEFDVDRLKVIVMFYRTDEFWAKNFMTPLKLLKRNKDGIRYIDYFFERLKNDKKFKMPETEAEKIAKFGPAEPITEADIEEFKRLFPDKEVPV